MKFKTGDWVIVNNSGTYDRYIYQIKEFIPESENCFAKYRLKGFSKFLRETELLPWQPKKDEWCWFYDKEFKTAILAKYISMCKTEVYTYFRSSYHIDNGLFLCCEPFIGELPSWIKG